MKFQVPIPNSLFRIGLLLMIIKVFFALSGVVEVPDSADMIISLVACLLFAGSMLQKRYSTKTWMLFLLFLALAMFTSLRTGNLLMFNAVITWLAMCGEDMDETVRFLLFWETIYMVTKVATSFIFHFCGFSMLTKVGKEMQFNFGFSHPNVFACIVTNLISMYFWLHYDTVRWRSFLVAGALIMVAYMLTGSRTAMIVTIFMMLCILVFRNKEKLRGILRFAATVAVPALSVFFYVCCRAYTSENAIIYALDSMLSTRIKLGAYGYNRFGISFWGQDITDMQMKWDPYWRMNTFTFDNVYTNLMVVQLVWLLVIGVMLFLVAKKGDTKRCVFVLVWALYGISEIHVINPYLFFAILMGTELFGEVKYKTRYSDTGNTIQEIQRGIS